jgi:tetratricopeptide (TPR) repeat protein
VPAARLNRRLLRRRDPTAFPLEPKPDRPTAMPKEKSHDLDFDIRFFESVLRRSPNYTNAVEILGGLYTRQGRITDGLRMDRRLVRLRPANATARYNLACSLALLKRKSAALRELRQAIELGYRDFDWMQQDPDLEGLKGHEDYQALLELLKTPS